MEFRRLFELFNYQKLMYAQKIALARKQELSWRSYSTDECIAMVNQVSAGLLELGLKKGEKAAIIAHTPDPKWTFLDFGMQQIGIVVVPLSATFPDEQLAEILKEAHIKIAFVSNRELFQRLEKLQNELANLEQVYTWHQLPDIPGWDDFITVSTEKHTEKFQHLRASIHEDDLATIVYTSGTTDRPKGVMLSHKNIISNIKGIMELVPVNCDKRVISYLPLNFIFERVVTYVYIAVGASIYYPKEYSILGEQLKLIKPHFFTAVPKTIEDFYVELMVRADAGDVLRKKLNDWAFRVGAQYDDKRNLSFTYWLQLVFANLFVFRWWRKIFGGQLEGIICGAANLNTDIVRTFSAANIEVREGYGLTETSPVVSLNGFETQNNRFGTVGMALKETKVKIDQLPEQEAVGEILVKGPGVMLGYFNNPKLTQQMYNQDGWLKTGDVGELVDDQFIRLIGRKSSFSKLTNGTGYFPEQIEKALKSSPLIYSSLVVGNKRPFISAIILPNFKILRSWCKSNSTAWTAPQFMILQEKVIALYQQEIALINQSFRPELRVENFLLTFKNWNIFNGETTASKKEVRDTIIHNYSSEIEKLYPKS